jgi:hypothetical protein
VLPLDAIAMDPCYEALFCGLSPVSNKLGITRLRIGALSPEHAVSASVVFLGFTRGVISGGPGCGISFCLHPPISVPVRFFSGVGFLSRISCSSGEIGLTC